MIWVWEDGGVLEGMGNEGMGKGGMMEGCGGELEGVVGAWCVFVIREGAWGSNRENGDSFVSEVLFVCVVVCCVTEEFSNAIGGR